MKHFLYLSITLFYAIMIGSCGSDTQSSIVGEEGSERVTFSLSAYQVSQQLMGGGARAEQPVSVDPQYLLVLDVFDGAIVSANTIERGPQTGTQVLNDVTLQLASGSHTLYFLASTTPYSSYSTTTFTATWNPETHPMGIVWALKQEYEAGGSGSSSANIQLPLVVAKVEVIANDEAAANLDHITLVSSAFCTTYNMSSGRGQNSGSVVRYRTDATAMASQTGATASAYTFVPASGIIDKITANTFFASASTDSEANRISYHVFMDVPVSAGTITRYRGNLFGLQQMSLSVENMWQTNELEY